MIKKRKNHSYKYRRAICYDSGVNKKQTYRKRGGRIMQTVIGIIYLVAGYWAANKVLYEGKTVFYTSELTLFMKKFVTGLAFGWILIPVAIIKSILQN